MSHFISLIKSMTTKNFGNKGSSFLVTAICILHVLYFTVYGVVKEWVSTFGYFVKFCSQNSVKYYIKTLRNRQFLDL